MRIGHGFDVHSFAADRPLILGGVVIPCQRGLAAHSDGDVLLHALMDAILGALGEPDIGQLFPPDDDRYLGADSADLLAQVAALMCKDGYRLVNCDIVVMAEKPKLLPYLPSMRSRIAALLGAETGQIGLKGTTTEKLGFVGREEGIAASAVVLLEENHEAYHSFQYAQRHRHRS